jgi:type II secretory pathway pseudopilin PulG
MNKKLTIINIALVLVAVFLAYMVYRSISRPVIFENTKRAREEKVVQNLKGIRDAQDLFKEEYNRYTANFDSLVAFVKTGQLPIVNRIQDPNDTTFTKTIDSIVGYINVMDSLHRKYPTLNVETFRYVPFSDPQQEFEIQAGYIMRGGMNVPVFEVKAHYNTYLIGLDKQRIRNDAAQRENLNKYPGLKVGSMTEPSTDGNWENL